MPSFNTFPNLIVEDYIELPDGNFLGIGTRAPVLTGGVASIAVELQHFTATGSQIETLSGLLGGTVGSSVNAVNSFVSAIDINDNGILATVSSNSTSSLNTAPNRGYLSIGQTFDFNTANIVFTPVVGEVSGMDVAVQADNSVLAIWSDDSGDDGAGFGVYLQEYNIFGIPVGPQLSLAAIAAGDQTDPDIVTLANDAFAMVYVTANGGNGRLRLETFNADATSAGVANTLSPPGHDADNPRIDVLNNGNFAIVYEDAAGSGVYLRIVDQTGTPVGGPIRVSDASHANPGEPSVLGLQDGTLMVAFSEGSGFAENVFAQHFDAAGTPIGDLVTVQNGTFTNGNRAQTSAIVELADGSVVVGGRTILGTADTSDYLELTGPMQVFGYAGNDILLGSGGSDTLDGGDGSDILNGNAGPDYIYGGDAINNSLQLLLGGGGDDYITTIAGSLIRGGAGNDLIVGGGVQIFNPDGSGGGAPGYFDDSIEGGLGDDLIYGREGDDLILGEDGDDIIRTGRGADTVEGGNGNDFIFHGGLAEPIHADGGGQSDTIFGGNANDTLIGGTGNDRLRGRDGDDVFIGGPGADRFIFIYETINVGSEAVEILVPVDQGDNIILDFEDGADRLWLSSQFGPGFGDLELTQNGAHVEVALGSEGSVILYNMAGSFDASDVIFT